MAGNLIGPRKKVDGEYFPRINWWRQPYLASFRSGNFDFAMLVLHVRWGKYRALTSKGLCGPPGMVGDHGTNLAVDKSYDQILHDPTYVKSFTKNWGVLDFYQDNHKPLFPGVSLTKTAFTYQMSDHLPLWVQINKDIDEEELDQVLNRKRK